MKRFWPLWIFSSLSFSALSAPLIPYSVPLYLGTTAEPNILFVIDDSGSMDWEIMSRDFANGGLFTGTQPNGTSPAGTGAVKHRDSDDNGSANCSFGGSQTFYGYLYGVEFARNTYSDDANDCNTADDQAWRFRNYQFNPLYFNPNRTYAPWSGVDAAGIPFTDMPITSAKADPYYPTSETIDLTRNNSNNGTANARLTSDRDGDGVADGFRYYTWTDKDNDGLFDNGEETEYLIKNADAVTQQNFANWFSYYRSRSLSAKAAYGKVIADAANVRMGLMTINNNNSVKTAIASINSDFATGTKRALLDALYSFNPGGGTPLRTAFNQSCKYLDCASNTLFSSCPRLEQAQGGACQQNFAMVMTDGFYNDSFSSFGNKDGDHNTLFDGGAYADSFSNTMADIAMYYYERDLHTDITNNVPVVAGVDEASHQHVVTYTVAFGVEGTVTALPADPATAFSWPNPASGDAQKIDDLLHAAYNGRGKHLAASNAQQLIDSLNDTIADIGKRTSSASAVALNSASLKTDTLLYQARFDSGNWSGQLLYYPLLSNGAVSTPKLDAGEVLESKTADNRQILSFNPDTQSAIPFRWTSLTNTQKTLLHTDPDNSVNDGEGEARANYIRGDTVNEGKGKNYRDRARLLGDIVHSTPVFVGKPHLGYTDTFAAGPYSSFAATYSTRREMIYVGANDGMLHGFDAETGEEVFSYIPNALMADLTKLTSASYAHRYYVDGTPLTSDIYVSGKGWRSVLVGGLGAGGKAYFGLDITNPSTFSEANAASTGLWEYSHVQDPDVGLGLSEMSIVNLADGQWGVVLGNSYNSCSPVPQLIILNAYTGAIITKIGTDGRNFAQSAWVTALCASSAENANGLSSPAVVDMDGDRIADFAYAGDLNGNLWRFDLRANSASAWSVSYNQPLFTAKDGFGAGQPITTRPMVGFHPDFPNDTGFLVYFGTGKYLESVDNNPTGAQTQSFYAIWDKNDPTPQTISRANLLQQKILAEVAVTEDSSARITSSAADGSQYKADWTVHMGWFIDLINTQANNTNNRGERQVTNSILKLDRIIFTTLIPNTEQCGFGGGGWLMELDARDGSRLSFSIIDLNNDGVFDAKDQTEVSVSDLTGSGSGTMRVPVSGVGSNSGGIPSAPTFIYISPDWTASGSPTGGTPAASDPPTIVEGWSQRHQQSPQNQERVFMSDSRGNIKSYLQDDQMTRIGRINWQQLR